MNKRITCIIPAHNEEDRITKTLKIVCNHRLIDEVIVIDDFSKDRTANRVREFKKVKLITNHKNEGKSKAIVKGIRKSAGKYLLLLDADLKDLTKKHITQLITPVLEGEADISIGMVGPNNIFNLSVLLSGQRFFKKEIFEEERFLNLPSFGFESVFNLLILKKKLRIRVVDWIGVKNTLKTEKLGLIRGLIKEYRAYWQINSSAGIIGMIRQIIFLRFQNV